MGETVMGLILIYLHYIILIYINFDSPRLMIDIFMKNSKIKKITHLTRLEKNFKLLK